MILNRFLRNNVTIVRYGPGPRSRQGNPSRVEIGRNDYPAHLEQTSSQELLTNRDTVIDLWAIYLPPEAEIAAGDQVLEGTRIFNVEGTPSNHPGPGLRASHITARLRYISEVT